MMPGSGNQREASVDHLCIKRGVPIAVIENDLQALTGRSQQAFGRYSLRNAPLGDSNIFMCRCRRWLSHRVSTGQIHADSAAAGAEDEDEDLRIRIEALHKDLPAELPLSAWYVKLASTGGKKTTTLACHQQLLTCRVSGFVEPSRRTYVCACRFKNASRMSSIRVIWVKIKAL